MTEPRFLYNLLNKTSKKKTLLLIFAVILFTVFLPILLINLEILKPKISSFILEQIKSKFNSELVFKNPNYEFRRFKLFLSTNEFQVKQEDQVIVELKNFKMVYPLRNLLRSKQVISSISADKLYVKAIHLDDDSWNLENILKPSDKKADVLFKSLQFHDTDLEINSQDFYEKVNVYLDIHKDKKTKLYHVEFYNNKDVKNVVLADATKFPQDRFYITGEYDLNNTEGVYKYVKNLQISLLRLRPDLIKLISRAFTPRKSRFRTLFNKYSNKDTELSLYVQELIDQEEDYILDMDINNLVNGENLELDSKLHLSENVNISKLNLKLLKANFSADGLIANAFSKNPSLDLNLYLKNFNPYLFRERFPEIKLIISDKVAQFTRTVHKSPTFNFDTKVTGSFYHPEIKVTLPIENLYTAKNDVKKTFLLDLVFRDNDYLIKTLQVPFEYADLNINGTLSHQGAFDLKMKTQDFPLRSLKPIAMTLLPEKEVKAIKDVVIQGYIKSDLTIKKAVNQKSPDYFGSIILAKTSILEPNIPILMQDISAELSANKNLIKISSFEGSLYENKVDLNGFYNTNTNEHKLNLSSPKFDLSKIEGYQIKKYFPAISKLNNIRGEIKNLELKSADNIKDLAAVGKLDNISFDYVHEGKTVSLKQISSDFAYANEVLTVEGFKAYINDNSSLDLDGLFNLKNKAATVKANAKRLPFEILSMFDVNGLPLHAKGGIVNFDLDYDEGQINAFGDVKELSFNIDSEKMPENFRSVNADFKVDEDFYLNGLTAYYGNSLIKAKSFNIKQFRSQDKYYDIDLDADLKISEFDSFIPKSIAEFLHMEGYLPLHVKAIGDKHKFYLDVDGDLNRVDKLVFSEWFDYDNKVKIDFKTSFSFTPKLILSKNTVLNLKGPVSSTTVAADFEVHDWKEKKELRYSIDAYTPLDGNGEFIPIDLDLIEPHIKSIETLNLNPGTGTVQCRTDGDLNARHSFCDIEFVDQAVAKNFGIGDLVSKTSSVYLISIKDKPVYIKVKLFDGLWKILDFTRVKFDMEITEDIMQIDRVRAKLDDGFIRSNIEFNFKDLASKFKIKANNVSAHKLAESFFALGHEVPQGIVSGQFEGTTKGLLPDEMFMNLEAEASVLVRDGKLSSLKTMQKLLSAINTLKNFDFNNVFQTLITYKGGVFQDLVSYLKFDKGKITTEKLLLHSDAIEMHFEGFVDYANDYLTIRGLGAVPERSNSFLQLLGIKQLNLGNLLSIINLRNPGSKDKDYFAFSMKGPANDLEEATQSLRQNFTWLNSYGSSD